MIKISNYGKNVKLTKQVTTAIDKMLEAVQTGNFDKVEINERLNNQFHLVCNDVHVMYSIPSDIERKVRVFNSREQQGKDTVIIEWTVNETLSSVHDEIALEYATPRNGTWNTRTDATGIIKLVHAAPYISKMAEAEEMGDVLRTVLASREYNKQAVYNYHDNATVYAI